MHNIAVRRVCRRPLTPAQAPAAVGADIAASSPQGACRRLPPCGHRRCRRNSHRGQGLQPACTPPSLCTRPPPCHRPWRLLRHASSRKRPAVQPPNPVVTVPDPWPAGLVVAGRRPGRLRRLVSRPPDRAATGSGRRCAEFGPPELRRCGRARASEPPQTAQAAAPARNR